MVNGSVVPLYRMGMDDGAQSHQTVVFRDGEDSWTASLAGTLDATSNVAMKDDLTLAQFMERPIKIASYNWDPTAVVPFFQTFNPWTLFFENKRVVNRINNYNNMQAKLKVKIMVNGNPFYYGRIMADYFVRPDFDTLTPRDGSEANLVMASQRLKIFIDPTTSQGGELHFPMILPNNAMSIPLAEWREQGRVYLREVAPLKHANGSVDPITISVYAWAEDVKLSIPTLANSNGLVFQGSEYGSRPVSNIATNVAKIAGHLTQVPWLAPYAKATQLISSGIGKAAFAMGFSRPAIIENPINVKRNYMGNLCNADRGDHCTRLTLDSKQELTIDPATIGISAQDEMNIKHLVQKECYIGVFDWTTLRAVDDKLFTIRVSPHMARVVGNMMYNSPMAMIANLFTWWRGTINYRFQIIASQYHKGRLLFVFDPTTNQGPPEQNVQYSRIVDLSNERDFTISVCWGQNKSYLPCLGTIVYANECNAIATPVAQGAHHNGFLSVYVLNELSTPNSSVDNDIKIALYTSGGDNLEFNVLSEKIRTSTYLPFEASPVEDVQALSFQSQSIQPREEPVETMDAIGENAPQNEIIKECVADEFSVDHTNDVFFGETISSLRQLFKRYVFLGGTTVSTVNANSDRRRVQITDFNFPRYRGYITGGANVLAGGPGNMVNTTVLNYITPCYTALRGSLRSKYLLETSALNPSVMKMTLFRTANVTSGYDLSVVDSTPTSLANSYEVIRQSDPSGLTGTELIGIDIQPALEVEFPHYRNTRFSHTKNMRAGNNGDYNQHRHRLDIVNMGNSTAKSGLMRYVSAGEDFQLFLFQGQPPLGNVPTYAVN